MSDVEQQVQSKHSTNVQRLAKWYLKKYGPVNAITVNSLQQSYQSGAIEIPEGYSQRELGDALTLVNVISFRAYPEQYEAGTLPASPQKGQEILDSQALRSPSVQAEIAKMLPPSHEYVAAIAREHEAQAQATAHRQDVQQASQTLQDIGNTGMRFGLESDGKTYQEALEIEALGEKNVTPYRKAWNEENARFLRNNPRMDPNYHENHTPLQRSPSGKATSYSGALSQTSGRTLRESMNAEALHRKHRMAETGRPGEPTRRNNNVGD